MLKKLMLACTVLLVVGAFNPPSAKALPICFKWDAFCDGIEVDPPVGGVYPALWYHWDCNSNWPIYVSNAGPYSPVSVCGTTGQILISSFWVAPGPPANPGDWYFVLDTPLDGTLDMYSGIYGVAGAACWIPGLAYTITMGACTGGGGSIPSTTGTFP